MSLAARNALYFKYTITARFRLSPAPSSSQEVRFLLRSFQKIASVDYFHVSKSKFESQNPYGQVLTVMFNASEQLSQVNAFSEVDSLSNATPAQLEQRQSELIDYIKRICGAPRYSYVKNDDLYSGGKSMVPFRHKLLPQGDQFSGEYEISPSTSDSPFFLLSGNHSTKSVLPFVRHNFQRLHKLELLHFDSGLSGLHYVTGTKPDIDVTVNMNHEIDTAALMNINTDMPHVMENSPGGPEFRGILQK